MTRAIVSGLLACAVCVASSSVHVGAVEAQGAGGGTITGSVKLAGPSPGNPIIRMGMDPMCGKLNAGKRPINEIVLRSEDGGLANAFVDLEGKFAASPAPSATVVLDQRNCVYAPRVIGARTGQTLKIVNNDPLLHNVHSHSTKDNSFNFTQPKAGMSSDVKLKGRDVVMRVGCDVHSWMVAYVGVEEHPYYAVSGTDGGFKISGVPAGRYAIRVWHERFGQLVQMVTVSAGKTATVNFSYTGKEKPAGARVQDVIVPSGLSEVRLLAAR